MTPTREQVVLSFEIAKEEWLAHDDWQYADREAAWKFFYLHGRTNLAATIAEQKAEIERLKAKDGPLVRELLSAKTLYETRGEK